MVERFNISFAGAGKVGSALCRKFFEDGHTIGKIVTETPGRGKLLSNNVNAGWSSIPVYPGNTQILIVAVPDHKLEQLLRNIDCPPETIIAHSAGSYGLEVFPGNFKRCGVFYPLQTFAEGRITDFREVPFLIEASDKQTGDTLEKLARSISRKVFHADAAKRRMIHVAAVFVCNFTNYMLTAGTEIVRKSGFSPDILSPLINETISKALSAGPENSQTGPAVRNDLNTIAKHLELLSDAPDLQRIYNELTESIINYYKQH